MREAGSFLKYTRGEANSLIEFAVAIHAAGIVPLPEGQLDHEYNEAATALRCGFLASTDLLRKSIEPMLRWLDPEGLGHRFVARHPTISIPVGLTEFVRVLDGRQKEMFRGIDTEHEKLHLQRHLNAVHMAKMAEKYQVVLPEAALIADLIRVTPEIADLIQRRKAAERQKVVKSGRVKKQITEQAKTELGVEAGPNPTNFRLLRIAEGEKQKRLMVEKINSDLRAQLKHAVYQNESVADLRAERDDLELSVEYKEMGRQIDLKDMLKLDAIRETQINELQVQNDKLEQINRRLTDEIDRLRRAPAPVPTNVIPFPLNRRAPANYEEAYSFVPAPVPATEGREIA